MHQVASRHYAFEGRCFVLAAGSLMRATALPGNWSHTRARSGRPSDWVLRGGSAIVGPDGATSSSRVSTPCIDGGRFRLGRVREEPMTLDVSGHYHRPELLRLEVERSTRR